jgi:cytochrome b561
VIWKMGFFAAALLFALLGWAVISRAPPRRDTQLRALHIGAQAALLVLLLSSITFPAFNSVSITATLGVLLALCFAPRTTAGPAAPAPAAGRNRERTPALPSRSRVRTAA